MALRNRKQSSFKVESLEQRDLMTGVPYDAARTLTGPAGAVAGDVITITDVLKNVGSSTMSNFLINSKLGTRLSTDTTPSPDDIELIARVDDSQVPRISAIKAGETKQWVKSVRIPDDTPTGDYYIVCKLEDSQRVPYDSRQQFDSNLSNNTQVLRIHIDAKVVQVNTSMKLVGSIPGGKRGEKTEKTSFSVKLLGADGQPISGVPISFSDKCDYFGTNSLGTVVTNSQGIAKWNYTIPKSVFADNVSITARFAGNAKYKAASYTVAHVEIGRKN